MKLDDGKRISNNATMHVIDQENTDIKQKLANSIFSEFVNKDSLQRRIPQEVMFFVEFLITNITSNMYGLLVSAIQKSELHIDTMQKSIDSSLNDLKDMQKHFRKNADVLNTKRCNHE
jgi:hypothetical protein